jgi:hypothetical protein
MNKCQLSIISLIFIVFFGCTSPKPNIDNSNKRFDDSLINSLNNLGCKELLYELVKSSNFKNNIKKDTFKTYIWIDENNDSIMRLKLYIQPTNSKEIPVGWLVIDFIKNRLLDVTFDYNSDNPIELSFDKKIFFMIKSKCK